MKREGQQKVPDEVPTEKRNTTRLYAFASGVEHHDSVYENVFESKLPSWFFRCDYVA